MASPTACVLGLGSMGMAMATRLREQGLNVSVWNRSPAKIDAFIQNSKGGSVTKGESPAAAVRACAADAVIIAMLSDTSSTLSLLDEAGVGESLSGLTFVALNSGNPDDGRAIASKVMEVSSGKAYAIDGAYCGPPGKVLAGAGQLFLSSEPPDVVERARPVLEVLGSVSFCGKIGASRALDYAVVDLFFVNLLSFMSNKSALEREGVDMKQFYAEAAKRLQTIPGALEAYNGRMDSREEADYNTNVTVSLNTGRSYWASRLPYNHAHGIPSHLTNFLVHLLDEASGGAEGVHGNADLSRLQEVVRFGEDEKKPAEPV